MKHETKHESLRASAGANMAGNGAPTDGGDSGDGAHSGVAREYHAFLSDVQDLLSSATSMTAEDFARAKAKLSARISAARASVGRAGSAVADRARNSAKATDHYVREQPWQAVGISAVAGLLIGLLLGRRGS
jgi:ElaB/YqjD/DUF883 family membrane-anchored ribosome-binding protein